ncbi:winged helix-turn-helix domain-containing protein [Saccharibacillus deserti]|uniref:winged helix-turn-helix domain-containing protein n=1 Tax=Saccharibacillus deserti TaxID=1634444 RepID=UPI001557294E|nr:winged helix-turn-helix domain-containing protein [Saccharibacillus deserti]
MPSLRFDDGRMEAEYGEAKITLLAKEYALLRFLHANANRVFSREQLLDRLWPGEYPTDRTVDDHIYRLRKKLKAVGGPPIETIRGVGYCLAPRPSAEEDEVPSLHDPAVQEAVNGIFSRYHRLGQGRAMLALAAQHRALGFRLDSFYGLYLHFVEGDLRWFLENEQTPMSERIYWLLLFELFVDTPGRKSEICERALRLGALPPDGHREMEILNIADLYAAEDRIDEALAVLDRARRVAEEQRLDGFVVPIEISALYVRLMQGGTELAAEQSALAAGLLEREPYLRELAGYRILEGARLELIGRSEEGEALIREGLDTFERSGFVPHRLVALHRLCGVLRRHAPGGAAERLYSARLQAEYGRFGLNGLQRELGERIRDYLDRLEKSGR